MMDIVDSLFVYMFNKINTECQEQLEAIREQYPFEPLKVPNLRLLIYAITDLRFLDSVLHHRLIHVVI